MPETVPPPPVFVLVLDEVLVATDIALIIGDSRPDARIVVARSIEKAADDTPHGRIEAAFVQCDAARFLASTIGRRVAGDGGRVILVGRELSEATTGVSALPFPFVREDVAAVLEGMVRA
jgi:ssDNA-binding replication factor A large subunit